MKVICLAKRPKGTIVPIGGTEYHFKPTSPASDEHVADVTDENHFGLFVSAPEAYKAHPDDAAAVKMAERILRHAATTPQSTYTNVEGSEFSKEELTIAYFVLHGKPPEQTIPDDVLIARTTVDPSYWSDSDVEDGEKGEKAGKATAPTTAAPSNAAQAVTHTREDLEKKTPEELAMLYERKQGRKPPATIKPETIINALLAD